MSADRDEFEALVARMRAEADEERYGEVTEAVLAHVETIANTLPGQAPFSAYQETVGAFLDQLAAQHDWAGLTSMAKVNAQFLAAALVLLAQSPGPDKP